MLQSDSRGSTDIQMLIHTSTERHVRTSRALAIIRVALLRRKLEIFRVDLG